MHGMYMSAMRKVSHAQCGRRRIIDILAYESEPAGRYPTANYLAVHKAREHLLHRILDHVRTGVSTLEQAKDA